MAKLGSRKGFKIVQVALFISLAFYLTAKLTFGSKGILEYYNLEERFLSNKTTIKFLENENKKLKTKLSLMNENSLNVTYLEEVARVNLHFGKQNEKLIIEDEK